MLSVTRAHELDFKSFEVYGIGRWSLFFFCFLFFVRFNVMIGERPSMRTYDALGNVSKRAICLNYIEMPISKILGIVQFGAD